MIRTINGSYGGDRVQLFGENETVVQSVWKIFDVLGFIEDELDYIINTDRLAILLDVPKDNPKVNGALNDFLKAMLSSDIVEKAHLFAIEVEEAIHAESPERTVAPDADDVMEDHIIPPTLNLRDDPEVESSDEYNGQAEQW